MIVIFNSLCKKQAIKRTNRILDSFGNRTGERSWEAFITEEGLSAVKKLIRKTATKNTAVSCRIIRRRKTELAWIVGNRNLFNSEGFVAVGRTKKLQNTRENDWDCLPIITAIVALAALFHDWGKSSKGWQKKLNPANHRKKSADPLRHEFMSCLLFTNLIKNDCTVDTDWLTLLQNGIFNKDELPIPTENTSFFKGLPPAALVVLWLILTHHKLPLTNEDWRGEDSGNLQKMLKRITTEWGYSNKTSFKDPQIIKEFFEFPEGLPYKSNKWVKEVKKWAGRLKKELPNLQEVLQEGGLRYILLHARLVLMLGDHNFSSLKHNPLWDTSLNLYANNYRSTGEYKQKLDEHLIGVMQNALKVIHLLPIFEKDLPVVSDLSSLKQKNTLEKFKWQKKSRNAIRKFYDIERFNSKKEHTGVFVVMMGSTGSGKTFAIPQIMQSLSEDPESLRYTIAHSLRTLTLQTGDAYRKLLGFDSTEVAVVIGSVPVTMLHEENTKEDTSLLDNYIDFECNISEKNFKTIIQKERDRKFLYAPVVSCTVDQIIQATESKRGGSQILPLIRMMSSDIVLDEVDDFVGEDQVVLGRLIHLVGLLGRKIIISSATINPSIAEGYFNAYQKGYNCFSKIRKSTGSNILSIWVDEFSTQLKSINTRSQETTTECFARNHKKFVDKRIKKIKQEPSRRKGKIIKCTDIYNKYQTTSSYSKTDYVDINEMYFNKIKEEIPILHNFNKIKDKKSGKNYSFGVVRMVSIDSCISLYEHLKESVWDKDIDIKVMAYHSRQVLLLRSAQEKHLDEVLNRKGEEPLALQNTVVRNHLQNSKCSNVIFILVATSVEEVGRDHDFDWAILEPSSFRSLVQLVGRILRHRFTVPYNYNVAIMEYNLKTLKYGDSYPSFDKPGYESKENLLQTHNISELLDVNMLQKSIDAIPRITRKETLKPTENLIDLEHYVTEQLLTNYSQTGPEQLEGCLVGNWWLTAVPLVLNSFRKSYPTQRLFLMYENEEFTFIEKRKNECNPVEKGLGIVHTDSEETNNKHIWLDRNYLELLEERNLKYGESLKEASLTFGEISIPQAKPGEFSNYIYSDQFGLKNKTKV